MPPRSLRTFALVLIAAAILLFLSAASQGRISFDDLRCTSHERANGETVVGSAYLQQLSTIRETDRLPHSRTLGIAQKIYVIGLKRRTDRRAQMDKLMEAMDLDFEYHDALDARDKMISDILERIRWTRAQSRIGHEQEVLDLEGLKFEWLPDVGSSDPIAPRDGSDYWFVRNGDPRELEPLPPPPWPDTRPELMRTAGEDSVLPGEPLSRAQVSCWYSHYEALRKIALGEDEVTIILEDDIDLEWDLQRRLHQMWPHLPEDWDIIMLGYCGGVARQPVIGTSYLHSPEHILCTHAYAISKKGARKLVRYLRTPLFAFSRPYGELSGPWYTSIPGTDPLKDHAFQHLNAHRILNFYMVSPAVVIQTKKTASDIFGGTGGLQDQWLADSAMERIEDYEKLKHNLTHLES